MPASTTLHIVATPEKRLAARQHQPIGAITGRTSSGTGMLAIELEMVECRILIAKLLGELRVTFQAHIRGAA